MRTSLLKNFGLANGAGFYRGERHERNIREILDAMAHREMLAVIGPYGSGKTELTDMAARECRDCTWVYVQVQDKERLRIGGVLTEMIEALGETPRRSAQAMASQLARLLGERVVLSGWKHRVVVVIDQAHRLHASTLLAIKDSRELRYQGHKHMFGVLLVGQAPLMAKLQHYGEVWHRTDRLELTEDRGWMTRAERLAYLAARFGAALDDAARGHVAIYARTPLLMDEYAEELMEKAAAAGLDQVTEEVIGLTPRQRAERLGVSLAEVAAAARQATGEDIGKSTIGDVLNGRSVTDETRAKVEAGLKHLELEAA